MIARVLPILSETKSVVMVSNLSDIMLNGNITETIEQANSCLPPL